MVSPGTHLVKFLFKAKASEKSVHIFEKNKKKTKYSNNYYVPRGLFKPYSVYTWPVTMPANAIQDKTLQN